MRTYTLILLLIVALAVIGLAGCRRGPAGQQPTLGAGYPMTLTDSLKRDVTIPARPVRIVSTAPAITEILFAIGAGDRVVADTKYCAYPPEAAKLPHIGDFQNPSPELVAAMSPDLIVAMAGNQMSAIESMKMLKVPLVAVADPKTVGEVGATIRMLGRATGQTAQAETVATDMETRVAAVEAKSAAVAPTARPRVLYLITVDLFSVGAGTVIDDMIRRAGGVNIAAKAGKAWPQLSMETVITADPQVILISTNKNDETWDTAAHALAKLRADARWRNISAVKAGRLHAIDTGLVEVPGPRLVEGLAAMQAVLTPVPPAAEARR
jgi:iron complex transport system substrate-binding protein